MLNVIRKNIKSFYPLAILLAGVFVLLVFTDFQALDGTQLERVAAKVGSEDITFDEFERGYRNIESRYRETYGDAYTADLAEQMQVPVQAIETMINDRLLVRQAERLGLGVSEAELQERILAIPGLTDGDGAFIGRSQYQNLLRANRYSIEEFETEIRTSMLVEKLRAALSEAAHVSDAEVERRARDEAERAAIRYIQVPASRFAAEAEPTEAETAAYFEANRDDFQLPERRRVGYLLVDTNTVRGELEVTDEEVQQHYDDHGEQFEIPEQVWASHILLLESEDRNAEQAQEELNDLRRRLEAGEDFAALATEHSDDEATRDSGGDLGYFGRGAMTQPFEEAAFAAAAGDLIGPIENQLGPRTGHHLIRIHDRREGGKQPLDEVANLIEVQLLSVKAEEEGKRRIDDLAERLADQAFEGETAAREFAAAEGSSFEIAEPFAEDAAIPGLGRNFDFSTTAFALETGAWSQPVRVAAGWAVLALLEALPPRDAEFAEVEADARAAVREEREADLLTAALTAAKQRLGEGLSLDDAAAEFDATVEESGSFGRRERIGALGAAPDLSREVFALSVGEFGGPVSTPGGGVLFEVSERELFDPASFDAETVREELLNERTLTMLQAVLGRMREELGVSYTKAFIENFGLEGSEADET